MRAYLLLSLLALAPCAPAEAGGASGANPAPVQSPEAPIVLRLELGRRHHGTLPGEWIVENRSASAVTFQFSNGRQWDVECVQDGNVVWRASDGRMFIMAMTHFSLAPGESRRFAFDFQPLGLAAGDCVLRPVLPDRIAPLTGDGVPVRVDGPWLEELAASLRLEIRTPDGRTASLDGTGAVSVDGRACERNPRLVRNVRSHVCELLASRALTAADPAERRKAWYVSVVLDGESRSGWDLGTGKPVPLGVCPARNPSDPGGEPWAEVFAWMEAACGS